MIKKGFFIAASLMIVGCGVKNGKKNNINNENSLESYDPSKEMPAINLPPKPPIVPEIKQDVDAVSLVGQGKNYTISEVDYTDHRTFLRENIRPISVYYSNISGNFNINVKKLDYNLVKITYSGIAHLQNGDDIKATIDCTETTEYEAEFFGSSYSPINAKLIKNGCKVTGLILFPQFTKKIGWFEQSDFFTRIGVSTNPNVRESEGCYFDFKEN
ncbi:hypothetical protein GCL60_16495 [Silvanigrella paludirubra]|uniref:Lipoprotein n=1 Tax=Silvanigrella paludirubra TaxID=2499159 RepID=A0A6N6VMU8_9BACT|nr:hypothetical protein [Silvanigrella paludirubra]KAB8035828.1 hypothetical protein GCL60_16495 [Silvanigrella paludirubra]